MPKWSLTRHSTLHDARFGRQPNRFQRAFKNLRTTEIDHGTLSHQQAIAAAGGGTSLLPFDADAIAGAPPFAARAETERLADSADGHPTHGVIGIHPSIPREKPNLSAAAEFELPTRSTLGDLRAWHRLGD